MDAVNAMIHLVAAIGFAALGFKYIQEQRRSRRILALARWSIKPETAPPHLSSNLGEVLEDLCQVLGVRFSSTGHSSLAPQIIRVRQWLDLFNSGDIESLQCNQARGRFEIDVRMHQKPRLTEDQIRYFESGDTVFAVTFQTRGSS